MRRLPALFLVVVACDASVRLGAIESGPIPPAALVDASAPDGGGSLADAGAGARGAADGAADAGPLLALATGMPGAEWIAVGPSFVTWTTSAASGGAADPSGHFVAAKDGSGRVALKSEPGVFRGVVADEPRFNALRWVSPVSLIERASATTSLSPHVTGIFLEGHGLAVDDTDLYAAMTTKLARIDKTAEAGTATLFGSFVKAVALASDTDALYVADQADQRVVRVDKATENIPWSHPVGAAVNDVAVFASLVYFAGGGRAGHVQKTGAGLTIFDVAGVNALAVDASGIYYATPTAILHAELAAPATTTALASGLASPGRLALDADFVYFTDPTAGAVYRLRK